MPEKEKIIAFLRTQSAKLSEIRKDINECETDINELMSELEDESRLGSPVIYDFGSKKIKKFEKNLDNTVKKYIKELKKIHTSIENMQDKSSAELDSYMKEFLED